MSTTSRGTCRISPAAPRRVEALLADAVKRAEAFAADYRGRMDQIDGPGLATAMRELAEIEDAIGRAYSYAALSFATNTADPPRGALLQLVQEQATAVQTLLVFWDLEWAALSDERAEELLANDELDFARHHLESARRYRPHLLSEPEEKLMSEKAVTGRSAWDRLFEEQTSAMRGHAARPGRARRPRDRPVAPVLPRPRRAPHARPRPSPTALRPGLRTRAYIFNTLLADKALDDRLRDYPTWLSARNLANEASDESVEALVSAVRNRYEIARRWYRLKAQLLGARPARRLRPHGRRLRRRGDRRVGGRPRRWCRTASPASARELGDARRPLLRRVLGRRARPPGQARRRLLRLHDAVRAPVRDAQLHGQAPRRPDARARARPRRARRARRVAGRLPHVARR